MTINNLTLTSTVLTGIIRRQPRHLDLSWSTISEKQLSWLLPRLPQMQSLTLKGTSALTLRSLHSCNTPLFSLLDISWTGTCDDHVRLLLSKPPDSRPGLMETKTRLRFLTEIKLQGLEQFGEDWRIVWLIC